MDIAEMNIRAKYATNTASGADIDKYLNLHGEAIEELQETVGDEDSGLVKAVNDLDTEKQDALTTESVPDGTIDDVIGFDDQGNVVKGAIEGGTKWTLATSAMTNAERKTALESATLPYALYKASDIIYPYIGEDSSTWYFGGWYYNDGIKGINVFSISKSDGGEGSTYLDYSYTTLTPNNVREIPSSKAIADYIATKVKTLYRHSINLAYFGFNIHIDIINDSSTAITNFAALATALNTAGFTSTKPLNCSGCGVYVPSVGVAELHSVSSVYSDGTTISVNYRYDSLSVSGGALVIQGTNATISSLSAGDVADCVITL